MFDPTVLRNNSIAIYGLSAETERLISHWGDGPTIVGLLDGFRESGEMFGYPILSLQQVIDAGVELILVVARPGSCKVIAKRIGDICREHGITVIDTRGNDLLEERHVGYEFPAEVLPSLAMLTDHMQSADVISFDLFDTLVTRMLPSYTDLFDVMEGQLKAPGFAEVRLQVEKELSRDSSPSLIEIYDEVLRYVSGLDYSASELAEMEYALDTSLLMRREAVCGLAKQAHDMGRQVVITTDTYYSAQKICEMLEHLELTDYDALFVSSESGVFKSQGLFEQVIANYQGARILHIGNDGYSDGESASRFGLKTFLLPSCTDLFDAVGGLGIALDEGVLADRAKAGLLCARLFNNPFGSSGEDSNIKLCDAYDIGYLLCGPIILDFALWMKSRLERDGIQQILFGSRDGYLLQKVYDLLDCEASGQYFLTSRTAAIRAGVTTEDDVKYVESMKFFGEESEALLSRFGVKTRDEVLQRAAQQRENYRKYVNQLGLLEGKTGFFDFVAKGTTQLFLERIIDYKLHGYYFLQNEPENMARWNLDIQSFYSDEEKDGSAIFDFYYVLETILTSPYPQVLEFDGGGQPVYAKETRNERDLQCIERMQAGVLDYAKDYLRIVPAGLRLPSKRMDEQILSLITKLSIYDEDFLALTIEDPFYNRMTAMQEVLLY